MLQGANGGVGGNVVKEREGGRRKEGRVETLIKFLDENHSSIVSCTKI